jgi:hypothetical protein
VSRTYNVFLSWSGERSRSVAEYLRGWLSAVVQAAKPWMSESEIDKGSRSLGEISKALSDIKIGIVCLTPENLHKAWLFFEAGALSKSIDERTRLCTYLVGGLKPSDVSPPLGMFQGTTATKDETLKLIKTINKVVSDDPLHEENLENIFEAMWPKLETHLASLPPASDAVRPQRSQDEIMAEILELARAQASYREKTQFIDAYIPTFQQFLPLLHQLIVNTNKPAASSNPTLAHPRDTSLERTSGQDGILNTFGFPKSLQRAMPVDPRMSGRRLDLIQMFGGSGTMPEGPHADIRFTLRGLDLAAGTEETYDIDFKLEIATARKIALYLEQIADSAERNHIRFVSDNIQRSQKVREVLAESRKDPQPEG